MRFLTLSVLLALLVCSCSVKEERLDCPCELSIFPDESFDRDVYGQIKNSFFIADSQTGQVYYNGSIDMSNFAGGRPHRLMIPRSQVSMSGIFGIKYMSGDGDRLLIKEGRQADSVFVYYNGIDCQAETASDTLELSKQWCSLRIIVSSAKDVSLEGCCLISRWNGFDLATLSATEGNFEYEPDCDDGGNFLARIPRQGDNSLLLNLTYDGGITKAYQIGESISEARYDWGKKNLDDIVVYIDKAKVDVTVVTSEWDRGTDYGNIEM